MSVPTTLVASEPTVQEATVQDVSSSSRLLSLDVFRGGTIAAMMLVNNAGNWNAVYPPLRHSAWHGWTFTDTIFPFFLWIAGVSMTFSFAKRLERNDSRAHLLTHMLQRAATIFLLGLFLNLFPLFQFSTVRIPGVLQRIAVCYLIAGVIFLYTSLRGLMVWTASLLLVYSALMNLAPVPGFGAGSWRRKETLRSTLTSWCCRDTCGLPLRPGTRKALLARCPPSLPSCLAF